MARGAWIGDFVFVRHSWRDESERMGVNIRARDTFRFDLRHVAGDALTSRTAIFVVRMPFERGHARAVWGHRAVTVQADLIRRLDELRIILRAMHIVTGGAGDAMPVHDALRKVVTLHPVLMRRAVWKVVEIGLSQRAVFESPEVL